MMQAYVKDQPNRSFFLFLLENIRLGSTTFINYIFLIEIIFQVHMYLLKDAQLLMVFVKVSESQI